MKYLLTSVTIGACLLLSSAGVVFAGQQGTGGTGVAGCGSGTTANPITQPSPLGQQGNTHTKSPFPTSPAGTNSGSAAGKYAGMGPNGNYGAGTGTTPNTHANSQYDNACLHQVP